MPGARRSALALGYSDRVTCKRIGCSGLLALALGGSLGAPTPAVAQPSSTGRFAEEPTGGVTLPAVAVAGTHDGLAVVANPAGLLFLRGAHVMLAASLERPGEATSSGSGVGLYGAGTVGGRFSPRLGLGIGVEALRGPQERFLPDPGTPLRVTLAGALPLGGDAAVGFSWHRFVDDPGENLAGLRTWNAGLSARLGRRWAAGGVVRDLGAPAVAGAPVQRRYETELVSRPWVTDRLELGAGGRLGETRGDLDGWLRFSARLGRGLYLRGMVENRVLYLVNGAADAGAAPSESRERQWRLSAGLELSFGGVGATVYGSGAAPSSGRPHPVGGTLIVRGSQEQVPSLLGARRRIERLELSGPVSQFRYTRLVAWLRHLAADPGVAALFVELDGLRAGWATLQDLRGELLLVRGAGKKVFAYMVTGTTGEYFVATAADKIYIDAAGGLGLAGFAGTKIYFKSLFDSLGVNAQFEKIEEYKSAPEQFTRTGPSQPASQMQSQLYDDVFAELVAAISQARNLPPQIVRQLIDAGPFLAADLESENRLVDGVAAPSELEELVFSELGGRHPVASAPLVRPARWGHPAIAVVHLEGDIVRGKSRELPVPLPFVGRRLAGSDTIATAIAAARTDSRVKAIVLRIESPGGSAVASELMAREVFATRGAKPIICSLANVAASGGYFAAAGCDVILAQPTTVTGSIGVFYGKFDLSALFTRLGLSWRTDKRGQRADMETLFRPFSPAERVFIKGRLSAIYRRFVAAVAKGRGLSEKKVNDIGRGRVWSGRAARRIGLVDELGGLGAAIEVAKQRAGLRPEEEIELVLLPESPMGFLGRLSRAAEQAAPGAWDWAHGLGFTELPASVVAAPHEVQARLPFAWVWH